MGILTGVCNELDDFGCVGADGHGASMAGDDGDVKELFDRAINAEPFGACSFGKIYDLDAAPWFAVGVFQLLIERQPFNAFVAGLGQADIGKAVAYFETAGKAGAGNARHKLTLAFGSAFDNAKFNGARV